MCSVQLAGGHNRGSDFSYKYVLLIDEDC